MYRVLIISGSARPNSAGNRLIDFINKFVINYDEISATIADVSKLNLPFFDADRSPADPEFFTDNKYVNNWTQMVAESDGFIFVTPEYNTSLSAIQKNAIDWIYKEWNDKPILLVGYGWHRAERVHNNARLVLNNVKANVLEKSVGLMFKEDIEPDGSLIDEKSLESKLDESIKSLIEELKK